MGDLDRSDISIDKVLFRNFINLNPEQKRVILSYRNHDIVRNWMFNSEYISEEDHFSFIQGLTIKPFDYYWAVIQKKKIIAVVYLNKYNPVDRSAYWGYYLNPRYIGTGRGLDIQFYAMQLFFNSFKLERVLGQVKEDNKDSLSIQTAFNFEQLPIIEAGWFELQLNRDNWLKLPENLIEFKLNVTKR